MLRVQYLATLRSHCQNGCLVAVRREIDSLNERLTGDGQIVEGGDPNKGALKAKGKEPPCFIIIIIIVVFALVFRNNKTKLS